MQRCKRFARNVALIKTSFLRGQLLEQLLVDRSHSLSAGNASACTSEFPVPEGVVVIPLAFLEFHSCFSVTGHQSTNARLAANKVSCNCYYMGRNNVGERCAICKSNQFALPSKRSKGERNGWDFQKPVMLASTATFPCCSPYAIRQDRCEAKEHP